MERFRNASIRYGYVIERASDEATLLTGSAEVACLRRDEGFRPTPLPPDIRGALERYREAGIPQATGA